jgi:hypothetical protein
MLQAEIRRGTCLELRSQLLGTYERHSATSDPKFEPIPRARVIFNHSLCDICLGTLLWYRRLQTIADFDFRILEVHWWPLGGPMTNSN